MKGISTRNYQGLIPQMARTICVSKSNISRQFIEQSEMFTINQLGLPGSIRGSVGNTNAIESPYLGVRAKTCRVKYWRDGQITLRWVASALDSIVKRMQMIMGYQQLWVLEASLEKPLLCKTRPLNMLKRSSH
jgi:transposase-like protein